VLLTGNDDRQEAVAGLEAGADDYLAKPFHAEELRARLRAAQRIVELHEVLIQEHGWLPSEAAHNSPSGSWSRGTIVQVLQREVERWQRTLSS
jgi:two-component system cell cycle response regulator